MIVFFVNVTNTISLSILMKTPYFASKNLTKMNKLYQFLKIQDQFEVKKSRGSISYFWTKK